MPLGAARIALFAKSQVTAVAEVIRRKVGVSAINNAQIDTAQSQFGGASLYTGPAEDGNFLLLNNLFSFGTGNFTIETWVYLNSTSDRNGIFQLTTNSNGYSSSPFTNQIGLQLRSSTGNWRYLMADGSFQEASGSSVSINTWYHLALVRNGSTVTLYVDGTAVKSSTDTYNYSDDYYCGVGIFNSLLDINNGYLDEFRISNTARYTANFTPSTTPFQNDDNTLLLLHMDGTDGSTVFEDDNGVRAKAGLFAIGSSQIDTAQSKFGGASAVFDGSLDWIAVKSNSFTNHSFEDDFTIEGWVRISSFPSVWGMFAGGTSGNQYVGLRNFSGTYAFGSAIAGTSGVFYRNMTIPTTPTTGVWYHWALSKSGSNLYHFWNGDLLTTEYNFAGSMSSDKGFTDILRVGNWTSGTNYSLNGHLDDVRFSNTARYTATFTPPTESFVNDANTLLLLHMDGTDTSTDFEDDNGVRTKIGVSAVGNAQVDTAQSQFGGASAVFDGSGDKLFIESGNVNLSGVTNYTVECWYRPTTVSTLQILFGYGTGAFGGGEWFIQHHNSLGGLRLFVNSQNSGFQSISANIWYHIAYVKQGNDHKIYLNGTQWGSTISNATSIGNHKLEIGDYESLGQSVSGNIDEVRISNTARYTANFTAPTAPFQNDDNTLLLLHMDGTDGSTTFIDDNGVPPNHDYGA